QVQIVAPGELRVSEGRAEYTLRANRILVYGWVAAAAQVDRWVEELTRDLTAWCSAQDRDWAARPLTVPGADVRALWSRVRRRARRAPGPPAGAHQAEVPDGAVAPGGRARRALADAGASPPPPGEQPRCRRPGTDPRPEASALVHRRLRRAPVRPGRLCGAGPADDGARLWRHH